MGAGAVAVGRVLELPGVVVGFVGRLPQDKVQVLAGDDERLVLQHELVVSAGRGRQWFVSASRSSGESVERRRNGGAGSAQDGGHRGGQAPEPERQRWRDVEGEEDEEQGDGI